MRNHLIALDFFCLCFIICFHVYSIDAQTFSKEKIDYLSYKEEIKKRKPEIKNSNLYLKEKTIQDDIFINCFHCPGIFTLQSLAFLPVPNLLREDNENDFYIYYACTAMAYFRDAFRADLKLVGALKYAWKTKPQHSFQLQAGYTDSVIISDNITLSYFNKEDIFSIRNSIASLFGDEEIISYTCPPYDKCELVLAGPYKFDFNGSCLPCKIYKVVEKDVAIYFTNILADIKAD